MGQRDIALYRRGMSIHHHVDTVTGLDRDRSVGSVELVDGNDTLGLIPEVDDDFLIGDFQNMALQNLAFGRGAKCE